MNAAGHMLLEEQTTNGAKCSLTGPQELPNARTGDQRKGKMIWKGLQSVFGKD